MSLSRRHLLGLAAAAVPVMLAGPALAEGVVIKAVRIDASGLAQRGLPNYARRLEALGQQRSGAAFSGLLNPGAKGGATLVISIDTVSMSSNPSASGRGAFREEPLDYISGKWTLVDARGGVIKSDTITASRAASDGGPWYLPDNESRREQIIIDTLLYWVRREL